MTENDRKRTLCALAGKHEPRLYVQECPPPGGTYGAWSHDLGNGRTLTWELFARCEHCKVELALTARWTWEEK